MRILLTQESDWLKRNAHQQHHLAELMSLRGHEVRVIDYPVMHKLSLWEPRVELESVTKIYPGARVSLVRPGVIGIPGLDYLSLLCTHGNEIEKQMQVFGPDVVVGFGILNSWLALRACERHGVPFVYYWIDVLHDLVPTPMLRIVAKRIERVVLKRADGVLTINKALTEYVIEMRAPAEKTRTVSAGVELERFAKSRDKRVREEQRTALGLAEDDFVLFFMGWLYRFSGLVEVAERMREIGDPKLKLVAVGDGDAYDDLKRLAAAMPQNVLLLGKQPYEGIPELLSVADVCILPARLGEKVMQHNVPIKLYEYLAAGKPVVSTQLPGVFLEFGREHGVAYSCAPGASVDVALGLKQLDGLLAWESAAALRFSGEHTWQRATDSFENILREVAG